MATDILWSAQNIYFNTERRSWVALGDTDDSTIHLVSQSHYRDTSVDTTHAENFC